MPELTAERLRELLDYDAETGVFKWRVKVKNIKIGDVAGCISVKRYRMISIDNVTYLAHRLAWFHFNGSWPQHLDHINRDCFDNRISNLREATPEQNMHNRAGDRNSKTKIKGVYPRAGGRRFEAWIMRSGKHHYLGRFPTCEAAASAYAEAAARLHGEFART